MNHRTVQVQDVIVGAVLRMSSSYNEHVEPFSDCIVTEVKGNDVTLMRPFYSMLLEAVDVEKFTTTKERLANKTYWQLVLQHNGEPVSRA